MIFTRLEKIFKIKFEMITSEKPYNAEFVEKILESKKQIEEGSNFKMKAIINSEDPGVTQNGGEYSVTKESGFIKEFKEMAFTLDVGQVSKPFKSEYGYHIVQLNAIKGNT